LVDHAGRAGLFVIVAGDAEHETALVVPRTAPGLSVEDAPTTVGARGLCAGHLALDGVRVERSAVLAPPAVTRARALARLGLATTAVGLAQAALEAALRYSREREAFGTAICHHQAIQLKLADMATAVTAARLLTAHGAERLDAAGDDLPARMARLAATETALAVTLEAMRIHGGYGYTTEFAAERYYRDAPRLALALGGNDAERAALAHGLVR
jgi:alkylation response protein AidB-like acyl-CoA dehydrogenase